MDNKSNVKKNPEFMRLGCTHHQGVSIFQLSPSKAICLNQQTIDKLMKFNELKNCTHFLKEEKRGWSIGCCDLYHKKTIRYCKLERANSFTILWSMSTNHKILYSSSFLILITLIFLLTSSKHKIFRVQMHILLFGWYGYYRTMILLLILWVNFI